jgi:nucleoid DNA-binding protein
MTKADLVEQVYEAIGPGITKKDCSAVIDGFLNAVKQALANDQHIEIRGFGTFKVKHRKPRTARNPRTGESVHVPARAVPVFKPSRLFKTRVAEEHDKGQETEPPILGAF